MLTPFPDSNFKPAPSGLCTVSEMSDGNLDGVTCDKFIDNFHLFLLALRSVLASFSSLFEVDTDSGLCLCLITVTIVLSYNCRQQFEGNLANLTDRERNHLPLLMCVLYISFSTLWRSLFSPKWGDSVPWVAWLLQRFPQLWMGDRIRTWTFHQSYFWQVGDIIFMT